MEYIWTILQLQKDSENVIRTILVSISDGTSILNFWRELDYRPPSSGGGDYGEMVLN